MGIGSSPLRRGAPGRPGRRHELVQRSRAATNLGESVLRVLSGRSPGLGAPPPRELDQLPLPDLLWSIGGPDPDPEPLIDLLDLAFLGRASVGELDAILDAMPAGSSSWIAPHFADDLFLPELVRSCLPIEVRGRLLPVHRQFLGRVLAAPPVDLATVRARQAILRELEQSREICEAVERLHLGLCGLLALLRASRDDVRLEPLRYRLEVLQALREIVDQMAGDFGSAESGLRRIHEVGAEIQGSRAFVNLAALLDHSMRMATLGLEAVIGSNGRLRHLEITTLRELKRNPYYRRPLRRWWDRLRMIYRRYDLRGDELTDRVVMAAYHDIAPAMARALQLTCHLEVYLASRTFAARASRCGLDVCLPELEPGAAIQLEQLFNPLLQPLVERPVPSDLSLAPATRITLVTGPNSGGKTRLLQAIGICQVLAQSGLFAPCRGGVVPLVPGLFASIVEADRADQREGRLGTELMRLRTLFETAPAGSLILLDELCAGTNPSEAIEIIDTVLQLLRVLHPHAFVTTHFLDFANAQVERPAVDGLAFLQVEVDQEWGAPTFRFTSGVASTSLAAGTARRLGVAFDELERRLAARLARTRSDTP